MIDGISQFGILLLLLLTGMETDLELVRQVGRAAVDRFARGHRRCRSPAASRSANSCRTACCRDPGKRLVASLFLGTALSISSVKIVAMVVREMNFMRRNVGQIIVASAIIDDTIGWIIIADHLRPRLARHASTCWSLGAERDRHAALPGGQLHHRPAAGVPADPLGQRQFVSRVAGDHRRSSCIMGAMALITAC